MKMSIFISFRVSFIHYYYYSLLLLPFTATFNRISSIDSISLRISCTHREDNRRNTNLKLWNGSKIVQKSRQHSTRILIVESMLSLTIVNRVAVAFGGKGSVDVNAAIEDARAAEVMRQLRQGSLLWLQTHQYNWMPLYRPSTCF